MIENLLTLVIVVLLITIILLLMFVMSELGKMDEKEKRSYSMLNIKIKYIRDIKPIEFFDDGDWIDLRSGMDVVMRAGDSAVIPLGVAMEIPKGHTAIIVPRSSTFSKWGIIQTNSIGIIDESYCGDHDEWCLPVLALRSTKIHKNDRICQFRLIKQSDYIDFEVVKTLGNPDRNGFGSTGVQ